MNEFWDRYTELIIKTPDEDVDIEKRTKIITSDDLNIVFHTKVFDAGDTGKIYGAVAKVTDPPIIADIGIFNLSESTINEIHHESRSRNEDGIVARSGGSAVTLISGYRDNHNVIFTGVVAAMSQEPYNADVLTVLKCRDDKYAVKNSVVNVSYEKPEPGQGKTISEVVEDIANKGGIPIGRIDPIDIQLIDGRVYTQTQTIDDIFTELATECTDAGKTVRYRFKHGALYFVDAAIQERTIYTLTPQTGLLSMTPSRETIYANDSYDVTTLLLPDIEWMGAVKIGDYVCSVTTKPTYVSDGEKHITKFTATVGEEVDQKD